MSKLKPVAKRLTFKSEKDVKQQVKHLLDKHHWYWWMPPANGMQQTGIHDFHALKAGVFITVETKFGGNKLSENQKAFGQSISAAGALAFVVDEKTIALFDLFLQLFDKSSGDAAGAMAEGKKAEEGVQAEDGANMLDIIKALTEPLLMTSTLKPVVLK